MIATDASSLTAYLQGLDGRDVDLLDAVAASGELVLPPVVATEILSSVSSAKSLRTTLPEIVKLEILEGYWERAGGLRLLLKAHGLKAKTADALVAQACIDHGVQLITRDTDFRHFANYCGLKLA
ncbi:MAG: PIN domain-containing protein [Rhizomicrobium sp.]